MELSDVVKKINLRRGGGKYANVNEKDVKRAVKELSCLGVGTLEFRKLENNREVVIYGAQISEEVGNVLNAFMADGGYSKREKFSTMLVHQMIKDGQVWVDQIDDCIYLPPNFI